MQIVIAAHLADDGPEVQRHRPPPHGVAASAAWGCRLRCPWLQVQRLLDSLSARVATHESVAGGAPNPTPTPTPTPHPNPDRRPPSQ
eukprot:scaffold76090_cov36-Phaeocystis_antarctica.AAC.2